MISPDLTLNEKDHRRRPVDRSRTTCRAARTTTRSSTSKARPTRRRDLGSAPTMDKCNTRSTVGCTGKTSRRQAYPTTARQRPSRPRRPPTAPCSRVSIAIFMGDYTPYVLVTHDFGKTWSNIGKNLPSGTWLARSVRQDLHNAGILVAGTETGMCSIRATRARHGTTNNNLPTRLRFATFAISRRGTTWSSQPPGQALYIMDDLRPLRWKRVLRRHNRSSSRRAYRTRYSRLHGNDEGIYTDYAGSNPDYGSIFWYYQPTPGAQAPVLQFLDHGRVIRTVQGNREPSPFAPPSADSKPKPKIPNGAGLQSFTWGWAVDGPVKWNGAGRFFKGPDAGATRPPGTYGYRMTVDGKTFRGNLVVKADPSTRFTQAEMVASFRVLESHLREALDARRGAQ